MSGPIETNPSAVSAPNFQSNATLRKPLSAEIDETADEPLATGAESRSTQASVSVSAALPKDVAGAQKGLEIIQNSGAALSLASGSLANALTVLEEARSLVNQATDDTIDAGAREELKQGLNTLANRVDQNANVSFNDIKLLDGSQSNVRIPTGEAGQTLDISSAFARVDTQALGVSPLKISTSQEAQESLGRIDQALKTLGQQRNAANQGYDQLVNSVDNFYVSTDPSENSNPIAESESYQTLTHAANGQLTASLHKHSNLVQLVQGSLR